MEGQWHKPMQMYSVGFMCLGFLSVESGRTFGELSHFIYFIQVVVWFWQCNGRSLWTANFLHLPTKLNANSAVGWIANSPSLFVWRRHRPPTKCTSRHCCQKSCTISWAAHRPLESGKVSSHQLTISMTRRKPCGSESLGKMNAIHAWRFQLENRWQFLNQAHTRDTSFTRALVTQGGQKCPK